MARYKLKDKHYLNVEIDGAPTEWEQKELNQATGKEVRKRYLVPTLLDPDSPGDCNYPGEIIVSAKEDPRFPKDIIYKGPPTADMEPLDAEATAVIAATSFGEHPIESLPGQGTFSEGMLKRLEDLIDAASRNQAKAEPVKGITPSAFAALQEQVAALMAQNAELMASSEAKPQTARRA